MADAAQIAQQFQSILGRAPTPAEVASFGKYIDDGSLDAHEIGQVLQSSPEFQSAQLERNTTQFGDRLNAQNGAILDQAGAAANSRFASLGRANTSAMGASVMAAGGRLAQDRQSALADFYGRGLQQNAALGASQGVNALNRGNYLMDRNHQEKTDLANYYRQQNDFNTAKKSAGGWNAITPEFVASGLFSMGGKAVAAASGGKAGNPQAGQDASNRNTAENNYGGYTPQSYNRYGGHA